MSRRPVFSVVLLPSTPMKEEMLCTAGSQQALDQCLLALGHGGERDRLVGLGGGLQRARVLRREEAPGHRRYSTGGDGQRGQNTPQVSRDGPAFASSRSYPAIMLSRNARWRGAEPATVLFRVMPEQRAHSMGVSVNETTAKSDGHGHGDGELPEQPPHHVAHEEQRNQHRHQRDGQRDDGEAYPFGALSAQGVMGVLACSGYGRTLSGGGPLSPSRDPDAGQCFRS